MSSGLDRSRISRRSALGGAGALLLAGAAPWSASCAREDRSEAATTSLERALAAAKETGKPVLAFVECDGRSDYVGRVVGDMLQVANVELLAALGMCELAFATQDQLRERLGPRAAVEGAGLIDELEGELRWRPIAIDCARPARDSAASASESRARRNGDAVMEALFADTQVSTWAGRARAAATPELVRSFESRLTAAVAVDPKELHARAAIALDHARRRELAPTLAAEVWRALCERPPRGSRWAELDACSAPILALLPEDSEGVRYDLRRRANGDDPAARDELGQPIAAGPVERLLAVCGMATTTPLSARFLFVYADEP